MQGPTPPDTALDDPLINSLEPSTWWPRATAATSPAGARAGLFTANKPFWTTTRPHSNHKVSQLQPGLKSAQHSHG